MMRTQRKMPFMRAKINSWKHTAKFWLFNMADIVGCIWENRKLIYIIYKKNINYKLCRDLLECSNHYLLYWYINNLDKSNPNLYKYLKSLYYYYYKYLNNFCTITVNSELTQLKYTYKVIVIILCIHNYINLYYLI